MARRGEARIGQTRRARKSQLSVLSSRKPDTKPVVLCHSILFIRQRQLPLVATLDIALPSPSSVDVQVVNLSKAAKVGDEKLLEVCHIFGSGGLTDAGDVKDGRRLRGRSRRRRVNGEGARSASRPREARESRDESQAKTHLCIESCGQPMSTVRRPILETRGPTKKAKRSAPVSRSLSRRRDLLVDPQAMSFRTSYSWRGTEAKAAILLSAKVVCAVEA